MTWSQTELTIIESIKMFPILYNSVKPDLGRNRCPFKAKAWKNLAFIVQLTTKDLCSQWRNMLYSYIKINILIRNSEFEMIAGLKNDKHTMKYFDGSLSFLDAYIDHIIKDEDVAEYIHNTFLDIMETREEDKIETMFIKTVTQDMVRNLLKLRKVEVSLNDAHMEYVIKLVKESVDQSLSELKQSKSVEDGQSFETLTGNYIKAEENYFENIALNVEEKDMKKFCDNLADYVTTRFSLEKQNKLRNFIGSLVTEVEQELNSEQ